jgi:hypothetical protein
MELTNPEATRFIQDAFSREPVVTTGVLNLVDNNPASSFGFELNERGFNPDGFIFYGSVNNSVFGTTSDHVAAAYTRKYEYFQYGVLQSTTCHVHIKTQGIANPYNSVTINGLTLNVDDSVVISDQERQWEVSIAESDSLFPTDGVDETVTFSYITEAKELPDKIFAPLLDHRVRLTSAITTTTGITDVMNVTNSTQFISHRGELIATGSSTAALQLVVDHLALTHLQDGVQTDNYADAGEPYRFTYDLSERTHKEADGKPTQLSRFQLGSISFLTSDTAAYDVTVEATGRDPVVTSYAPRYLGSNNNIIGLATIPDQDVYKVGLQSQAKETKISLSSISHLPCTFQSAEWEGYVTMRSQRVQ